MSEGFVSRGFRGVASRVTSAEEARLEVSYRSWFPINFLLIETLQKFHAIN